MPNHMLSVHVMGDTKEGKVALRLPLELLKALDDLRRNEQDLPSRGEMVRRLITRAAEAAKGKPRGKT